MFKVIGIFPFFTTLVFYILVARVFLWNNFNLPYWKHPNISEIPFSFHSQLITLLIFCSRYIALPLFLILSIYLIYNKKISYVGAKYISLIIIGIAFYFILEILDPYSLFLWWLD
jgi:hypothetical protein